MYIINEQANFHSNKTGLSNIVIWVGLLERASHGPRIKVSNVYNKMIPEDCFYITLPDKVVSDNCKLKSKYLNMIFKFIDDNMDLLVESNYCDKSTLYLLENIKKYEK